MSLDTQNQFTQEEEELINRISHTIRRNREHELIRETVKNKIVSANFIPVKHNPAPRWKNAVYAGGSLLIMSFLVMFFVNNNNNRISKVSATVDAGTQQTKETEVTYGRKDSFKLKEYNPQSPDGQAKITQGTSKTNNQEAVAGFKGKNVKAAEFSGETLSFFEEYNFDGKADIKKFRSDLKIALERTDISFKDKSNKDDVISFQSENLKGIDSDRIPVEYFVTAKVEKRFPGSLKVSLRYKYEKGRETYLNGETINKIFYERIKSRVEGLISWKYKQQ